MTNDQIRTAIKKRPFQPFLIQTTGGETFTVGHPEAIWQTPDPEISTVIIYDKKVGVVFSDASCIADIVFATPTRAAE